MPDVWLANLNPGEVRREYFGSIINLIIHDLNHDKHLGYIDTQEAGCVMNIYRNESVRRFLESDFEWFFTTDSDMTIPPDALDKLLAVGQPVVSGLYLMSLPEGVRPSIFDWKLNEESGQYWMHSHDTFEDDTLVRCEGVGAGCLLIHRSVFDEMYKVYGDPEPWFATDIVDGTINGEDFSFCHRLKKIGVPIHVHTGVQCDHVKTMILKVGNYSEYKAARETP